MQWKKKKKAENYILRTWQIEGEEEIKPILVTCNEKLLAKGLKTLSSCEEIYKVYSTFFL